MAPEKDDNFPHPPQEILYWCDICQRVFAEKRCPQCGQKLKKLLR